MHAANDPAFGEAISNRLAELAALSDEPGRLTRLYLSPAHRRAIDLVSYWMRDAGMSVRLDPLANVVGRYPGQRPDAPALLLGSHIDTVRDAGHYDGNLGVITAIEAVAAFWMPRASACPFAIEVIAFGDEEGVRFARTLGGSRAFDGTFSPQALDDTRPRAITSRGVDRLQLRSVRVAYRETLRAGTWVTSRFISSKAPCWKGKAAGRRRLAIQRRRARRSRSRGWPAMPARYRWGCPRCSGGRAEMLWRSSSKRASSPISSRPTASRESAAPNMIPGGSASSLDLRAPVDGDRMGAINEMIATIATIAARRCVTQP